jgi:hypothetical protein
MGGNEHISYIQVLSWPSMVWPDGPSTRHELLKGYRVVLGLRLRPDRLARHDPFHFHVVSGLISKGPSPAGLRLDIHSIYFLNVDCFIEKN